jgi:outer membrane protein
MNKALFALIVATLPWASHAEMPVQDLLSTYQQAQASDPTWAAAQNANVAAQEKLVQGKALLLPTAKLGANAGNTQSNLDRAGGITNIGRSGHDDYETYGYNLNINQPLYRKQNSIQYEQSKTQVAQADEQLNTSHQDLMLRVSQAYFDVLLAQDKIDLILAQKAAISRQLEQAKANFEVGSATITDVHEAQARYDLTVAQEIAAVNELEAKKHAIQAVTGQMPQRLATAKSDLQAAIPEPYEMEKWVEVAWENNLALRIQLQSLQLANQEVERTRAGHLPTLDVVGSYSDNRANGGVSSDLVGYNRAAKTATVGLQFEIPLYQGGAISSKVREAIANQQKSQDDVEAARRQAELQTRQAYLNVTTSVAQVKAYEQALVSSQSQLDSTSLGYEVGVRTSVDVLNAQQQLYSAKRDLLQARYSWLLSVLQLKAAAGVLTEDDLAATNKLLEGS